MDVRAKLVELIEKARFLASETLGSMNRGFGGWYADYLIDHGVTVQEWISVNDMLPQEDEPEGATCEQVQVLLDNGVVSTGWCNRHTKLWWHLNYGETHFIGYDYEHTPVIAWQPLAQPPKGE